MARVLLSGQRPLLIFNLGMTCDSSYHTKSLSHRIYQITSTKFNHQLAPILSTCCREKQPLTSYPVVLLYDHAIQAHKMHNNEGPDLYAQFTWRAISSDAYQSIKVKKIKKYPENAN